jgi:hypothetical protein
MASTSHGIQVVDRERLAPEAGRTTAPPGESVAPAGTAPVGTGSVPAAGLGTVAVLSLLVAAWGGIIPFVGPLFGYSADGAPAWQWSSMHALLWLAPGAVAVAMALGMLGMVPRAVAGLARGGAFTAGMITVLCGAWFVIGPIAWPVVERSPGVFAPAGPMRSLADLVGYSFGPGVLLVLFGALAMGMAGRRRMPAAVAGRAAARRPLFRRHHRAATA